MIRALFYIVLLTALAVSAAWLAERPGEVSLTFMGYRVETSFLVAALALIVLAGLVLLALRLLGAVFGAPRAISRSLDDRRDRRKHEAVSRGLIAAAGGDPGEAGRAAARARRIAPDEPLTLLLRAQAAQLAGDRETANAAFKAMLNGPDQTRLLGLRGLYADARRNGDTDRARRYAAEASRLEPGATWSSRALLEYQTSARDWRGALETLDRLDHSPLAEKAVMKRHRAVLLTAQAMEAEEEDPDGAYKLAYEAHKAAPDLVPAAAVAARRASASGDVRRATKIVEATWAKEPHPELADIYAHARPGDSARDRLKRVRTLVRQRENHPEGLIALARAAIEAREWAEAREAVEPLARNRPTMRVCTLMAEIEEGQNGDSGRVREWLARAAHAPRDPVWTADGFVSERWMPISPVTGEIDAFRWKSPVEAIGGPALDAGEPLPPAPPPLPPSRGADEEPSPTTRDADKEPAVAPETPRASERDTPPPSSVAAPPRDETETPTAAAIPPAREPERNEAERPAVVAEPAIVVTPTPEPGKPDPAPSAQAAPGSPGPAPQAPGHKSGPGETRPGDAPQRAEGAPYLVKPNGAGHDPAADEAAAPEPDPAERPREKRMRILGG